MKLDSQAQERIIEPLEDAHSRAVDDALDLAEQFAARHSKTGRFEQSLERTETHVDGDRLVARIGSPLVSAKAKEKGAFITAKRGKHLVFKVAGGWRKVESVRLAPQPAVTPAGRRWPELLGARLREALR